MLYIAILILEIFILFLLSQKVHKRLGMFFLKITRNQKITVYILAILFLPGTFIHEIAHFLMALLMLVPVGNLELIPKIEADGIKLGSVSIAKTDPLRRFLIGVAPLILGMTIILSMIYIFDAKDILNSMPIVALTIYAIFTIGNTMFSSKRDLEGSWILLVFLLFIILLFWIFKITPPDFNSLILNLDFTYLKTVLYYLLVPILLDVLSLVVIRV